MELTKDQSLKFIQWYKERYGERDDVIDNTSTDLLGITEEQDIADWMEFLRKLLPRHEKIYKIRNYGKQTMLDKVFGDLYLNYGPKSGTLQ